MSPKSVARPPREGITAVSRHRGMRETRVSRVFRILLADVPAYSRPVGGRITNLAGGSITGFAKGRCSPGSHFIWRGLIAGIGVSSPKALLAATGCRPATTERHASATGSTSVAGGHRQLASGRTVPLQRPVGLFIDRLEVRLEPLRPYKKFAWTCHFIAMPNHRAPLPGSIANDSVSFGKNRPARQMC